MKLILPFVALVLAGTATGQQAGRPAGQTVPVQPQPVPQPVSPSREARLFVFPGGTPAEYLAAVDKEMGSHFSEIATIPEEAKQVRVPQVRAKLAYPEEAISIYNSLGGVKGPFGHWDYKYRHDIPLVDGERISPDLMQFIIFVAPATRALEAGLDVRAVSLRDIPEGKWKAFADLLDGIIKQQREVQGELAGTSALPFTLKIHPDTGTLVTMGGKEQMDQVEKLAATIRTSFAARPKTDDEGVQARAFSIAGLPSQTVIQLIGEMMNRSEDLRARQAKVAEEAGTPLGAGVLIFGKPDAVDSLKVLIVAGNSAGLEFARSLIEEVKASLDAETVKFVIVDGAVRSEGSVAWSSKLTVLDAIAGAGGLAEWLHAGQIPRLQVRLTRGEATRTWVYKELKYDPNKNERLQPGDHLEISSPPPAAFPLEPAAPPQKP